MGEGMEGRAREYRVHSSSESVLKVTYGNVGGIHKFSPVAGFHPILNCPHP